MKLERFDLYCGMGHSGDYRKECEDGEYVEREAAEALIDILKEQNAELLEALEKLLRTVENNWLDQECEPEEWECYKEFRQVIAKGEKEKREEGK